jgi:hypothetical protein
VGAAEAAGDPEVEAEDEIEREPSDVGAAANALRRLAPYFRRYRKTQVLVALGVLVDERDADAVG